MNKVEKHYSRGNILSAINDGFVKMGKDPGTLKVSDLSAVDEFHLGGRAASEHFFPKLGLSPGMKVLDIGAGIGGGARHAADAHRVHVTGIDLTREYVDAGNELSRQLGMSEAVELRVGDATSLDFPDGSFDGAFTIHVLMNIREKSKVFAEVFRVLKPGAVFGIFDIVKYGDSALSYPVPWAGEASTSFLADAEEYDQALKSVGFSVESVEDRHEFAVSYFKMVGEKMAQAGGPPPVGVHLLMGETAAKKLANVVAGLTSRAIAPFEFIATKPA